MLDIVAVMVVKDDQYYIPMAIQSVLPYVKGIYIQDQMSTDGTHEEVLKFGSDKIYIEQIDTGHKERFESTYNEPYWRTRALKAAENIFEPEWILKLDADEVYTEYFFNRLNDLLSDDPKFEAIRVSGDRPVSKDYWATLGSNELEKTEWSPEGGSFGDAHTQVWKAWKYYYINNPGLPGSNFHPILTPDPQPQYWLPGICNFHVHRMFGPKAFKFWAEGGDVFEEKTPFHAPTMAPKWYNHEVNMGTAEKRDFKFPDYILEKWKKWGIW